jgi:hypothetical protein
MRTIPPRCWKWSAVPEVRGEEREELLFMRGVAHGERCAQRRSLAGAPAARPVYGAATATAMFEAHQGRLVHEWRLLPGVP